MSSRSERRRWQRANEDSRRRSARSQAPGLPEVGLNVPLATAKTRPRLSCPRFTRLARCRARQQRSHGGADHRHNGFPMHDALLRVQSLTGIRRVMTLTLGIGSSVMGHTRTRGHQAFDHFCDTTTAAIAAATDSTNALGGTEGKFTVPAVHTRLVRTCKRCRPQVSPLGRPRCPAGSPRLHCCNTS